MVRTRRKYRNYSNVSSLLFCERGWKAAQAAIAAVRPCGAARRARRRLHRLVLGFLLAPQVQRFRFAYFWAATSGDDGVRWQRSRWRRCGGGGEARPHQTRRRPWTREGIAAEQTWDDVGFGDGTHGARRGSCRRRRARLETISKVYSSIFQKVYRHPAFAARSTAKAPRRGWVRPACTLPAQIGGGRPPNSPRTQTALRAQGALTAQPATVRPTDTAQPAPPAWFRARGVTGLSSAHGSGGDSSAPTMVRAVVVGLTAICIALSLAAGYRRVVVETVGRVVHVTAVATARQATHGHAVQLVLAGASERRRR